MLRFGRRHEYNEWARLIDAALGDALQPVPPSAEATWLGDAGAAAAILEHAGFGQLRFDDVDQPVLDPETTSRPRSRFSPRGPPGHPHGARDPERRRRRPVPAERLREMLAAHYSDERGVVLDSALLVDHSPGDAARRPVSPAE